MLDTAVQSVITALKPTGVEISYMSPDSRATSWIQVEVSSAPTPPDDLAERNTFYIAELSIHVRAKIESAGAGAQTVIHGLIEKVILALRNLKPDGAENLVQESATAIATEGAESDATWYICTLTYNLTLFYS